MGYAERAKQAKKNRGFRPPEGEYKVRLADWELTTSRTSGNKMFVLDWKVLEGPDADTTTEMKAKNRKLRNRFILSNDFSFDNMLAFLDDVGADLSQVREIEEDPEYSDFKEIFESLDKNAPDAVVNIKNQADSNQYYNLYFKEVEPVLAGKPADPKGPESSVSDKIFISHKGEVLAVTPDALKEMVADGRYSGPVNYNQGDGWQSLEAAGFSMPAAPEKPTTPEKPSAPGNEKPPAVDSTKKPW